MADRRPSLLLIGSLVGWAVFGAWALFRPDVERVMGLDPVAGHVVVFFFLSLAAFSLAIRWLGVAKGLSSAFVVSLVAAAVSEWLQPILTETRQAQIEDLAGDAVGIVAALVATAVFYAGISSRRRREQLTALCCVVGLVVSGALIVADSDAVVAWRECRGVGYGTIDDVAGEPVIHVEGAEVRVGSNSAQPLGDGLIADDSVALRCSVLGDNAYTIVATVVPATTEPEGTTPKRIFTSSVGIEQSMYNTHIGQDFDELSIRIRSGNGRQWESVPGVFTAGQLVTVAVVVDGGEAEVFVDGEPRARFSLRGSSLIDWDPDYPILIGDEFTRDRTFEGEIVSVSFFDRALDSDDAVLAGPG